MSSPTVDSNSSPISPLVPSFDFETILTKKHGSWQENPFLSLFSKDFQDQKVSTPQKSHRAPVGRPIQFTTPEHKLARFKAKLKKQIITDSPISPDLEENIKALYRNMGKKSKHKRALVGALSIGRTFEEVENLFQGLTKQYFCTARKVDFETDPLITTTKDGYSREHFSDLERRHTIDVITSIMGQKSGALGYFWYGLRCTFYQWYRDIGFPEIYRRMVSYTGNLICITHND